MLKFQNLSIQRKQMLIIMLTSSVALLLACAAFAIYEVITFRAGMVRNLSTLADVIANNSAAAVQFNLPKDATETLELLRSEKNIIGAWIFGRDGKVFAAYNGAGAMRSLKPPRLEAQEYHFSDEALLLHRPIRLNGEIIGMVYLKSDLDALYSRLWQYSRIAGLVLVLSLLVAFVLSTRLQRLVSKPILQLAEIARSVALEKNYSVCVPKLGRDEIGQLIDGFNEMLSEIQKRDAELQMAQDELENRVAHRTAELSHANERILKEFDERARAEERFQLVARATNDAVRDWDLATNALWWNQGLQTLFGYQRQQIESSVESWITRLHPDDKETVLADVRSLLDSGGTYWSGEYRFRRADGAYAYIFDRGYITRDAQKKAQRMVSAMVDITERKRTEEELKHAKEAAEAASLAKSQFLANMSHEIRTPMNGIIGMTELALETDLTAEQRGLLSTVRESADTLLHLINDILDFSKIEAGKLQLEPIAFNLRETLEDAVPPLALRAHEKGLEVAFHLPPEIPEGLIGDPIRLRQIVVNLLGNAIKFTDKGEVVLRVELERGLSSRQAQRGLITPAAEDEILLHFSVRDTGIGIPRDKQKLIFESFTQADNSTTRNYGGTGLGLAISTQLVEMMGGRMWVESEVGHGSTFHFTARFLQQNDLAQLPAMDRATLRHLPVLIVDDNATNRRILQEFVAKWGMKPSVTDSGISALEEMHRHVEQGEPFQLVLLDAMMPHMDGFTVAARIRDTPSLASAVIMMLSSAGQLEDAARCRSLGVSLYLAKPVKQSDLLDAILTALGTTPITQKHLPIADAQDSGLCATRSLRMLLAEDNPVNQRLAVRILEKWGHSVAVAGNGRKAIAAWEKERFDVILMDVQMPEMSGFEATRAIREKEKTAGLRTPIVAMTAHAMIGDRQRCLDAGMDDYVTKPIDQKKLFAVIESFAARAAGDIFRTAPASASVAQETPAAQAGETAASSDETVVSMRQLTAGKGQLMPGAKTADLRGVKEPSSPAGSAAVLDAPFALALDPIAVLKRVDGDRELLKEVVNLFFEDTPKLMADIRAAVQSADCNALQRAAHTLKGSASNFGVKTVTDLALSLERMGRNSDLTAAAEACEQLQAHLDLLIPALEALVDDKAA